LRQELEHNQEELISVWKAFTELKVEHDRVIENVRIVASRNDSLQAELKANRCELEEKTRHLSLTNIRLDDAMAEIKKKDIEASERDRTIECWRNTIQEFQLKAKKQFAIDLKKKNEEMHVQVEVFRRQQETEKEHMTAFRTELFRLRSEKSSFTSENNSLRSQLSKAIQSRVSTQETIKKKLLEINNLNDFIRYSHFMMFMIVKMKETVKIGYFLKK
jgi:chromosome segregation ATPase